MLSKRAVHQFGFFGAWLLALLATCSITRGNIFRWDNGQLIPGTEGITPGPGVQLQHLQLEYAVLEFLDLTDANLKGSNLSSARFANSTLTNAEFAGAIVTGASFESTTGFTKEHLYSSASYRQKNLRGIGLGAFVTLGDRGPGLDLIGWDLVGQDLRGAYLGYSTLTDANLTAADLRGASHDAAGAIVKNAILPDGKCLGLDLANGDEVVIRDDDPLADAYPFWGWWWRAPRPPIPITVHDRFAMFDGAVFRLVFESDRWDSLISFEPGIPVTLGGTLELDFASDVDVRNQIGRTIRLFNWNGVSLTAHLPSKAHTRGTYRACTRLAT